MRRLVACFGLLTLALAGCKGVSKLDFALGRASWQRPDAVVRALAIEPGARVADVGAGEGYFLPFLANAVGPGGRVYAVEVEGDTVQALEKQFGGGDSNVEIILGRYHDPELPDASIDLVLLVNTYHHIAERERYFSNLRRDLSPDGRVAILEPNAELTGLLSFFLEDGHQSRAAEVVAEMEAAGYRLAQSLDLLPVQIFEVFRAAEPQS